MRPAIPLVWVVFGGTVAACSSDIPSAPGYRVIGSAAASLHETVSPVGFMVAAGCHVLNGKPGPGAVAIPRFGGGKMRFDCAGVPQATIRRAYLAYRDVNISKSGLAFEQESGGGYWQLYSADVYVCEAQPAEDLSIVGGGYDWEYVNPGPATCAEIEVWWYVEVDGEDGGGDGGGGGAAAPNSIYLPPTIVPTSPDSACKVVADQAPVVPGMSLYSTSFGPMGSLTVQQALFSLADAAQNSSSKNELGGVILQDQDGTYEFVQVPGINSSPCGYHPPRYPYVAPSGTIVVGYVHTHPIAGTHVVCPEYGADSMRVTDPGISDSDWAVAQVVSNWTNANYIVDPTSITRYQPDRSQTEWARPSTPSACAQL